MQDHTIEYKVNVFISSKIDERYKIVRKALKEILLETNMTTVFIFEDSGASSQDVVSSYLNQLDDSDLCIFLVDNKDGVPDPVLEEQKRAMSLNKRCIYLFCDESKKDPTQMQVELSGGLQERHDTVHEFSDLTKKAYTSAIRDIIDIYRTNCKGQLSNKRLEQDKELSLQKMSTYKIDKNLFKNIDATTNELVYIVYPHKREVTNTSELDELCRQFLSVIIGNTNFRNIDFEQLKHDVCTSHDDFMIETIKLRYSAIKAYFDNNLEECLKQLDMAYDMASSDQLIPNWILNDIAVDMRNIQFTLDSVKNIYTVENKGQKLLKDNIESVFYPLLDRNEIGYKQDLLEKYFSFNTDSPYTTTLGGLDNPFKYIASCFYIAVMFGSLTHILLTRNRLANVLSTLCVEYREHDLYLKLINMLILEQKNKDIEKIVTTYNQTTDMINATDIAQLLMSIDTLPIPHQRIISLCLLIKYFGYYFSDGQYLTETEALFDYIFKWEKDNSRIFNIAFYIFEMIQTNTYRLDRKTVIKFVFGVFENKLLRWYDDALKILSIIDYKKKLAKKDQKAIIKLMITLISDDKMKDNCLNLKGTLICLRKSFSIDTVSFDKSIEKNMPDFFKEEYSLEISQISTISRLEHIKRFINQIRLQNEEQGKNGGYSGYYVDPYNTIQNIIEYDSIILQTEDIKYIITVVLETLYAQKQTISAKNRAISLIIYLKNKYQNIYDWNTLWTEMSINTQKILTGKDDVFFEKDTIRLLEFNFMLLKICFLKSDFLEVIAQFAAASQMTDYESIKSLKFIESLLLHLDFTKINDNIIVIIIQYISMISSNKTLDARYYAVKCLVLLTYSQYKQSTISQLSKMMDNGTYQIKASILGRAKNIVVQDRKAIDYIIQKGKVDNNYLVRKIAVDN
jgi:hypothetical protein